MAEVTTLEDARQTLLVGASRRRYICEIQRDIYDFIEKHIEGEDREKGLDLVAEAFWAGKRMSDRLNEFNARWEEDDWDVNTNFKDDLFKRSARLNLLKNIKSVNIGTIDYCNRKCEWCPNSKRKTSPDDLMSVEIFTRILRQLLDYNYVGEIHPFLNGEPMMDKRIHGIVKGCKKMLPNCKVNVITNGEGLRDQSSIQALFDSGVDKIAMNHYDGEFAGITKAKDSLFPNLYHFGMPELRPSFYNRAGKVDCTPSPKYQEKGTCSWFMKKLVFNHKGEVILCCSDFNYEVVFGNIMDNPLASILNSKLYRKYYYAHKEGKGKEMPLCKECNHLAS
jgi:radical SAM protein with 4Fe4S-binding SPASM domain